MNIKSKNYWDPTPKKYRVIGDSLLMLSTTLGASTVLMGHPTVGIIINIVGVIGKILTNFATIYENNQELCSDNTTCSSNSATDGM